LAAAQAFRDALLKLLPPIKPYVMRAQKPRSGMQGVVRLAGKRPAWLAELRVDGRKRSKTFSVKKYGEDGARRRAQEARSAWEEASGFGQAVRLPAREVVKQLEDSIRARFGEVARARTARGRAFNDDAMYTITRHERDVAGNGPRWSVTLSRRRVAYSKAFYDGVYGGIEPALIAARRFRDQILADAEPMLLRERQQIVRRNNTSGVAGVRLVRWNGTPSAWVASINSHAKSETKRFSIRKYGFDQALALATQARAEMLERVSGYWVFSPAAKERYAAARTSAPL
jgi:hypothetical protein